MKSIVIKKLLSSIRDLEVAIEKAKETLATRNNGEVIIDRIKQYEHILNKQKRLTSNLCVHAVQGEWHEVTRHVKLINALSLMIRDDARELLAPEIHAQVEVIDDARLIS